VLASVADEMGHCAMSLSMGDPYNDDPGVMRESPIIYAKTGKSMKTTSN
jgi:hypothetical protein